MEKVKTRSPTIDGFRMKEILVHEVGKLFEYYSLKGFIGNPV